MSAKYFSLSFINPLLLRTKYLIIIICISSFYSCSYISSKTIKLKNLPEPSGQYSIGTRIYNWVDESRLEKFTDEVSDKRKLVVQIWYPIDKTIINKSNYIDHHNKRILPIAKQFELEEVSPKLIALLLSNVKNIMTNAELDAEITPSIHSKKYPLILFSHGLGGMRMQNSIQIEELVSRGYVVIAPDHTYDANITIFKDGRIAEFKSSEYDEDTEYSIEDFYSYRIPQINTRASDLSFIINELHNFQITSDDSLWKLIDLDNIGTFGHSFGGGTGLVSMYNNNNIDACIALDGWIEPIPNDIVESGILKPFLYIGRPEWEKPLNYEKLDRLINNSNLNGSKIILPGTKHFDYTDTPYFNNIVKRIGVSGSMNTDAIIDTLNHHLNKFFDKHLKSN